MAAVSSAWRTRAQAVVEVRPANLGPDGTPALWLEGDLDTMAVQFLDSETGSAVTLKESTDFGRILAARTVRASACPQPKTSPTEPTSSSAEHGGRRITSRVVLI